MTLTISTSSTPFVQFSANSTQKTPRFNFPTTCTISLPSGWQFLSGHVKVLYCVELHYAAGDSYHWPYIGYEGTISSESNSVTLPTTFTSPTTFSYDADLAIRDDFLYNEVWHTVYVKAPNGQVYYLNNVNPIDWWYIFCPAMSSVAWRGELHYFDKTWNYSFDEEKFLKTRYTSDLFAKGTNVSAPLRANGRWFYRLIASHSGNDVDIFHKYQTQGYQCPIYSTLVDTSGESVTAAGSQGNSAITLRFYGQDSVDIVLGNGCTFVKCGYVIFRTSFYYPTDDTYWVADYRGSNIHSQGTKVRCTKQGGNPYSVTNSVSDLYKPGFYYTEVLFNDTVIKTPNGFEVVLATAGEERQYRIAANETHMQYISDVAGYTYDFLTPGNIPHLEYTVYANGEARIY